MDEYLFETRYCDIGNEQIQKTANSIVGKYESRREKAVALFEFVRDEIKYRVGPWGKKASVTLKERSGMCTNSANLLIALMRSVGISAGYGILHVRGNEYFGPIAPHFLSKRISRNSVHIFCYVYLDERWWQCDPSTDKELSRKTSHFNPTTELVNWDGKNNAIDNIDPANIMSCTGPFANIDNMLDKKPRKILSFLMFTVGNYFIDFLREQGEMVKYPKELEPKFRNWMVKKNFLFYYFYCILDWTIDIMYNNEKEKNN